MAASGEPADVAVRFATALAVCDALLNVVSGHAETVGLVGPAVADAADVADEARATAIVTLPILLYVNELRDEWTKHRDDVLWNPDEAKKKAKEEDEKRNKEALAAKFAHIKDDPGKGTVEL